MTLTRYLYNKAHVEYSLFLALLNRDREQAKFWIYELYHSGFKQECFVLVWKLYYQLYAGFFVNLEQLLKQQTLEWMEDNSRDWTIGTIVENMARREPCIEFHRMFTKGHSAPSGLDAYVTKILEGEPKEVLSEFVRKYGCFEVKGKKAYESFSDTIAKIPMLPLREACAARLFTGVFLLYSGNGFDRKVYVILGKDDVAQYKNKPFVQGKSWRILRRERKYQTETPPGGSNDDDETTSEWLSRAHGSPIWRQRIEKYGGTLVDGEIQFADENQEEQFDLWYNMEPDEQPTGIMSCKRTLTTWNDIFSKYACGPFNEWASTYTLPS
jgi:hypothetical protein